MRYYLAKNESEFTAFVRNFKHQIDYIAAQMSLDAGEVDELKAVLEEYEKDSTAQINARLNYKIAVSKKASSKQNVKSAVQKLVRRMRSSGIMSDMHFRLLNVPIHDEILSRSKTPEGVPCLIIEIRGLRVHKIEVRNDENMARAKPSTAIGAEIWVFVGDRKDLTEENMRYLGTATRSKFEAEYDLHDAGKTAHYMARWINRRGVRGDWSATRSATIAE